MAPPRRAALRFAGKVLAALVAVGAVITLGLIGVHSHAHRAITKVTPTTTAGRDPDLTGTSGSGTVTYTNTMVPITSGGLSRDYLLSRPAAGSTGSRKLPVIVVLHGRDATPTLEQQRTALPRVVAPSILVYPAGVGESWDAGNCCGIAQQDKVNDVAFVQKVIAQVKRTQHDAETGPVYLVGYSNGGKMALDLACQDPRDFAAIAVYGATDAAACATRSPSDLLVMGGTEDTDIPANATPPMPELDGFQPPSFDQEVDEYRLADGCSPEAVVTRVGSVSLTTWDHCAASYRMGEAVFSGQTHSWPEGSATSPSGGGVVWAWFRALGA